MSSNLVTVGRTHSLAHVVELMRKQEGGRVIVMEGKRLAGNITEGDLALSQLECPAEGMKEREVWYTRKLERAGRPRARYLKRMPLVTAGDVMRTEVLTVEADEDAVHAAAMMIEHGISGLPVVKGEKLVRIITKTDLIRGMASAGV